MTGSKLGAVLFDMDGLLVDSEPAWFSVERDVFARLGAGREWTPIDAQRVVGTALEVSAAEILRCAEVEPTAGNVEQVAEWFVEGMVDLLGAGAPWKPGAVTLLDELGRYGVPTALVSSSHRRLVDVVLGQLPPGAMAASVAGDEVGHTKPHPAPYLRALRLLGVRAEETVVLEDSPTGARSGQSAGCTVVVVPDLAPMPGDHAWHEVESLAALDVARLGSLLGGDGRKDVEVGGTTSRKDGREHPHQG
ncbi:MAG: HAD family phosphatase [Jiangellales bacterium]